MRRIFLGLSAIACAVGVALPAVAQPLTLSLQPNPAIVGVGDQTAVEVILSGLTAPPGIAGFIIELSYDALRVSPVSVVHGTLLGNSLLDDDLATNPLSVAEVSLEIPPFFDGQPASFMLATIFFEGLSMGTSPLTFGTSSLTDENVNSLAFSVVNGSIQVVPETGPTAFALVVFVTAAGLVQIRRLRRQA